MIIEYSYMKQVFTSEYIHHLYAFLFCSFLTFIELILPTKFYSRTFGKPYLENRKSWFTLNPPCDYGSTRSESLPHGNKVFLYSDLCNFTYVTLRSKRMQQVERLAVERQAEYNLFFLINNFLFVI